MTRFRFAILYIDFNGLKRIYSDRHVLQITKTGVYGVSMFPFDINDSQ
jgi:hypothetical protein